MLELSELPIYLNGDQPTTCGICGSRTYWNQYFDENGAYQINVCKNSACEYKFLTMDD